MPGGDAPLATAIEDRMHGDYAPFLENAHLVGRAVHLHGTPARGVGHAERLPPTETMPSRLMRRSSRSTA